MVFALSTGQKVFSVQNLISGILFARIGETAPLVVIWTLRDLMENTRNWYELILFMGPKLIELPIEI